MYIVKNALRNIARSKGRNILIAVIVLTISLSACIGLSIRQASAKAKESTLEGLSITAQISPDRATMMQSFNPDDNEERGGNRNSMMEMLQGIEELSLEELLVYAEADSVKSFYYSGTASLNGNSLEPVDSSGTSADSSDNTNEYSATFPGGMVVAGRWGMQGDFTLIGYSSDEAMKDFISGVKTISDGSMFEEGESKMVCIISDELALYNSLSVGDEIILTNPNNEEESYALTINGIYNNSQSTVASGGMMGRFSASSDPANQIYVSYSTLNSIISASADAASTTTDENTGMETTTALQEQLSGTYVFANTDDYTKFEEEVRALGLSDSYTISSSDLQSYEQSLVPLENLSTMALYFLIVVLIIGAIILAVLNIFNIRDRKYEVGVLTAIGMKKGKVAIQFVSEILVVTFIALLFGAAIGGIASVPVTNKLLESQVASQQENAQEQESNFGRAPGGNASSGTGGRGGRQMPSNISEFMFGGANNATEYITEVSSATDLTVLLQLLGIGILLVLVTGMVSVGFIMRYEPLKILANRD